METLAPKCNSYGVTSEHPFLPGPLNARPSTIAVTVQNKAGSSEDWRMNATAFTFSAGDEGRPVRPRRYRWRAQVALVDGCTVLESSFWETFPTVYEPWVSPCVETNAYSQDLPSVPADDEPGHTTGWAPSTIAFVSAKADQQVCVETDESWKPSRTSGRCSQGLAGETRDQAEFADFSPRGWSPLRHQTAPWCRSPHLVFRAGSTSSNQDPIKDRRPGKDPRRLPKP